MDGVNKFATGESDDSGYETIEIIEHKHDGDVESKIHKSKHPDDFAMVNWLKHSPFNKMMYGTLNMGYSYKFSVKENKPFDRVSIDKLEELLKKSYIGDQNYFAVILDTNDKTIFQLSRLNGVSIPSEQEKNN